MPEHHFRVREDCRWFVGEKPCRFKRLCQDCPEYTPWRGSILVIKLAALGDVMRTTCILPSLARAYPDHRITWVTDPAAVPLLACSQGIDQVLPYDFDHVFPLLAMEFDLALCLDKEPRAVGLVEQVRARRKLGFGMNRWGTPRPLNPEAAYAWRLGLDDELKFHRNQLTYQETIHQALDLGRTSAAYVFTPPERAREFGRELLARLGLEPGRTLGLVTGAGPVFAHKAWLPRRLAALADWARDELGLSPLLLGGPEERALNREVAALCRGPVADSRGKHDLIQFAGLVGLLRLVVVPDSLAMHLALAQGVPAVVLFGSTCPQEIMLTAPGRLLSAGLECQPCYRNRCHEPNHCMKALALETVQAAVRQVLEESA